MSFFQSKLYEAETSVDNEPTTNSEPIKAKVSDNSSEQDKLSGKALLCDVEEKEEHSSLVPKKRNNYELKKLEPRLVKLPLSPRKTQRQIDENRKTLLTLSYFDLADSLSRINNISVEGEIDLVKLVDSQQNDDEV